MWQIFCCFETEMYQLHISTGWAIDKDGNKKILKPVKNNSSLISKQINTVKNKKNEVKPVNKTLNDNDISKNTPSKKKKTDKPKVKKKRGKSPPSELDKELQDLKDETDDLLFRKRTKFTATLANVTFADVAGNEGK